MTEKTKLPIIQAAQYSWRFLAASWMPLASAYLIKAVIIGFALAVITDEAASGAGLGFVALIAWFCAAMICMAMSLRLSIKGAYKGVLGIQFGADEFRLMLAHWMYGGAVFIIGLIASFLAVIVLLVFVTASVSDPTAIENDPNAMQAATQATVQNGSGVLAGLIASAIFAAPLLWLSARMVAFPAATIARERIMIFETWSWTKNHALPVVLSLIVAIGPFWIFNQFCLWAATYGLGLPWIPSWTEQTLESATRMQMFILGTLIGIAGIPMSIAQAGLSAFMYRGFDPELQD